jgi:hypothetical protein
MRHPLQIGACAPGFAAPEAAQKGETPSKLGGTAEGFMQDESGSTDCAATASSLQEADDLGAGDFLRLQHRYEQIGFSLYPLVGDDLLVTRWGLSKVLHGAEAAARFLRAVGGAHG